MSTEEDAKKNIWIWKFLEFAAEPWNGIADPNPAKVWHFNQMSIILSKFQIWYCAYLRVISGSDIIEVASFEGVWSVHLIKFKALNFSLKKIIFQNMERKNTKTVGKWDSKWPRSLKRCETDLTRKILISKCKGFQDIACICLIFEVIQAMGDGYILFSFQSNSNNAMSGKLNAVFWSADQNLN